MTIYTIYALLLAPLVLWVVGRLTNPRRTTPMTTEPPPDGLFTTRRAASGLSPYELARRFLALPLLDRGDLDEELHALAVTSALARATQGWSAIAIHRALVAGATVEQVMDASTDDAVAVAWADWAKGQLEYGLEYGLVDPAEIAKVGRLLRRHGALDRRVEEEILDLASGRVPAA